MTELVPAETQQLVWVTNPGSMRYPGFTQVHTLPAGLSQRARRSRVGQLLVEYGARRRTVKHGIQRMGPIDTSVGDTRSDRVLAYVLPAGTATAVIELNLFQHRAPFDLTLSRFDTGDGYERAGQVSLNVFDPVPELYCDPEDTFPTWEQSDMLRWLDWVGLEPVKPGPIRLGRPLTVRTQVASLQLR